MSQLLEDGKVINVDGAELECVGVSYQEIDGVRQNFSYTFRAKSDVDADREAEAKRLEEEAENARLASEAADRLATEQSANPDVPVETTQPAVQPEVNKEETLNVK